MAQPLARLAIFPGRDGNRQSRHRALDSKSVDMLDLRDLDRMRLGTGLDMDVNSTSASGIEARPLQMKCHSDADLFQIGPPGGIKKMKAWAGVNMSASLQHEVAGFTGAERQWQIDGVQHQA